MQGPPGVEARVLQLGYALFAQREYRPLADLARLALVGGASSTPEGGPGGAGGLLAGMHLLRGLSLACQLSGPPGAARERAEAEAAAGFFAAAAGLTTGWHGAATRRFQDHFRARRCAPQLLRLPVLHSAARCWGLLFVGT
jgi:hypothetical protein